MADIKEFLSTPFIVSLTSGTLTIGKTEELLCLINITSTITGQQLTSWKAIKGILSILENKSELSITE